MKTRHLLRNSIYIIILALFTSVGCGGDVFKNLLEGGAVDKIVITPLNLQIPLGTTRQLTATFVARDKSKTDITAVAEWESSDELTATVSSDGIVSSVQTGTVTITATYEGITASIDVTISPAVLMSIAVSSLNSSAPRGTNEQFTATGTYSDLSTHDITNDVTWTSSNDAIAAVSNSAGTQGLALAADIGGPVEITAELDGISNYKEFSVTAAELVSIEVTPMGQIIPLGTTDYQYTATGHYTDSTTNNITSSVTWSSTDSGKATIASDGKAEAVGVGSTTIKAEIGGVEGSTGLTVTSATLVSISITPSISVLPNGATQQFKAEGIYSDASKLDVTSLATWESDKESYATVDVNTGLATAVSIGDDITISATYGGKTGTVQFDVTAAVLDHIEVTPVDQTIPKGTDLDFTATGVYTDSTTVDMTDSVLWESTNDPIASISNVPGTEGRATGNTVGKVTISATGSGKSGSTSLTVDAAALASISVTPANITIPYPRTQQYTATGNYTDGGTADLTSLVTWDSSEETYADISNATGSKGIVTTFTDGETTISATYGGKTGDTTLTVSAATLDSIIVTPVNPSLSAGMDLQFYATGVYSDKSTQDLTSSATWQSSETGYATIGASGGLATGKGVGTTTISASYGGKTGDTDLKVTSATLVAVTVTPTNQSIADGTPLQYTATGTYSDSTYQDITGQVTWSTLPTDIAIVSNAAGSRGLAIAINPGSTTVKATHSGSGLSGSTGLTVTTATLNSITITPTNPICYGTTQQFTATGNYSDLTTQDITSVVTWSSDTPGVATISNAAGFRGLATSIAVGNTEIKAELGAISETTTLEVRTAALEELIISPEDPTMDLPGTLQFTVKGVYTGPFEQDLTTQVLWTSDDNSVAIISNAAGSEGLVTAVGTGTATIKAERDGIWTESLLTVVADITNPLMTAATLINSTKVQVTYSEAVNIDQASDAANYKITASSSGLCSDNSNYTGATQTPDFTITSVTVISPTDYVLNLSAGMQNMNYTVLADKDEIRDLAATPNYLGCPNNKDFAGLDITPPRVSSATSLNPTTVRVTFSENVNESEAENKNNYKIVNAPASGDCSDNSNFTSSTQTPDFNISSVAGSGRVYDITLSASQSSGKSYTLLVNKSGIHDLAETPNLLGCANNADFTGLEQLKVSKADSKTLTSFIVTFSKEVKAGVDTAGSAGCSTTTECAKRYYTPDSSSLGQITKATILNGSVCNGEAADPTKVCVEHTLNQGGASYTIIVANNEDGDNFDNTSWGSIRDSGDTENVQLSPKDRTSFNGSGTTPQNFTDGPIATNPFADDSAFGYLTTYDGRIYIGPNTNGNAARSFMPDGTDPIDHYFTMNKDTSSGISSNSATTRDGGIAVPPYVTMGHTGCTANNANLATGCGPDNNNGRGLFTSGTISGTKHLFITGGRSSGNNDYMYWTTNTDATLDFNYIDLADSFDNTPGGGTISGNRGTESIVIFDNRIYWMSPGNRSYRPYLMKVFNKDAESDEGTDSRFAMLTWMTGFGYSSSTAPNRADNVGGTMFVFKDRLYIANSGAISNSGSCNMGTSYSAGVCQQIGGIIRSNSLNPSNCTAVDNCGSWTNISPSTDDKFRMYFSNVLTKLSDLIPADQPVPGFAAFNDNLYMIRNACTTSRWNRGCIGDECTDDQVCSDAQSVPQLWKCDPTNGGLDTTNPTTCESNEWSLVGENGSTGKTNMGSTNNTKITFITTNGSRMYIGFDNATDGVTVWRTKSGVKNPSLDTDFEQIGSNGLGNTNNQQIFSSVSFNQGSVYYLYLSVGKSGEPVKVYRQQNL